MRFYTGVVLSFLLIGASAAWGKCSVDDIPIQLMSDIKSEPITRLSNLAEPDVPSLFHRLVIDVTEHVVERLEKDGECVASDNENQKSLLQFVKWPYSYEQSELNMPHPPVRDLGGGCYVTSPWVDIYIRTKPSLVVRGIIRWNNRQILVDQAILAGMKNSASGVNIPLRGSDFYSFLKKYDNLTTYYKPKYLPAEDGVPPDLLWLFQNSDVQQMPAHGLFDVSQDLMENIFSDIKIHDLYRTLIVGVIDHCFNIKDGQVRYANILQVDSIVSNKEFVFIKK